MPVVRAEIPVADRDGTPPGPSLAIHDAQPCEMRFDGQLGVGDPLRFSRGRLPMPRHAGQRHQSIAIGDAQQRAAQFRSIQPQQQVVAPALYARDL
jgi:hypothetical protein